MKKSVKFILLGAVALIAVIGVIYYITAPVTLPLTKVTAKTAELSFSEQGAVVAGNVVQIYPLTQGRLVQVNVTEGQTVAAGDVLCVIDTEPLRLKINQIQSGIKGYEAQLANLDIEQQKLRDELLTSKNSLLGELAALEAQQKGSNISVEEKMRLQNIVIEQNQKDLDRARQELEKAEALYNSGLLAKSDYEAAQDTVVKCETALTASQQELAMIASGTDGSNEDYYKGMKESLNAQIAGIDRSLGKNYTSAMSDYYKALIQADEANAAQLEDDMANCSVVAMVGGIVTKLNAKGTNVVSSASPVAEITVLDGNTIEVYVSTKDVGSVKEGDTVGLTLKRREGDVVFSGTVTCVDPNAEIKLSALGVEERKVKVKVSADEDDSGAALLGVGYTVDVKFFIYNEENKFAVPKTSLYKDNGKDMLWAVRNGKAEAVEVVTGMELRTETVIEAGLREGDYVVTDANDKALRNGVKIKGE